MATFELTWIGGDKEFVTGNTIAQAFANAGYGGGAIRALDATRELSQEEVQAMERAEEMERYKNWLNRLPISFIKNCPPDFNDKEKAALWDAKVAEEGQTLADVFKGRTGLVSSEEHKNGA